VLLLVSQDEEGDYTGERRRVKAAYGLCKGILSTFSKKFPHKRLKERGFHTENKLFTSSLPFSTPGTLLKKIRFIKHLFPCLLNLSQMMSRLSMLTGYKDDLSSFLYSYNRKKSQDAKKRLARKVLLKVIPLFVGSIKWRARDELCNSMEKVCGAKTNDGRIWALSFGNVGYPVPWEKFGE